MLFKIAVALILILFIHFLQKRFGATVSGIVPGLPMTSGPISFFLALEQGRDYASQSALASIYGMAGISVFCFIYLLSIYRFRPCISICLSLTGWFLYTLAASLCPLELDVTMVISYCIMIPVLYLMTKFKLKPDAVISHFRWQLPLKILLVSSLILTLTYVSKVLTSHWVGLLATFPIILAVLGFLAHVSGEKFVACGNLKGGIIGATSSGAFFLTVSTLLTTDMSLIMIYFIATVLSICTATLIMKLNHYMCKKL